MKLHRARIHQNKWDNWYGYLGNKKVIAFYNDPQGTQEDNAKRWLQEQNEHYLKAHALCKQVIKDFNAGLKEKLNG